MSAEPIQEATAAEVELELYGFVNDVTHAFAKGQKLSGGLEAHATLSAAVLISKRLAEINATLQTIAHWLEQTYHNTSR
jgi:hypothetical protein